MGRGGDGGYNKALGKAIKAKGKLYIPVIS